MLDHGAVVYYRNQKIHFCDVGILPNFTGRCGGYVSAALLYVIQRRHPDAHGIYVQSLEELKMMGLTPLFLGSLTYADIIFTPLLKLLRTARYLEFRELAKKELAGVFPQYQKAIISRLSKVLQLYYHWEEDEEKLK